MWRGKTQGDSHAIMNTAVVIVFLVTAACLLATVDGKGGLQIGVKERPETCDKRTKKGDRLSMHYTVSFEPTLYVLLSSV